ncbi:hypothetical protein PFMALIP_01721 [Plasmodium falciparum MaliPS096_E11]|uniref:Uncharacterized protein n=3 Tax=Plasmodium falciparum TaxID=5833 RepID=A0A024WSV5_PLAFA|nr:hypothetical protein PFMALIP_01721 [Plasmodium falciparum MaliPS096_E11]
MKENVLTYRDIIKEDNTTLEKSANKQNLTIDSMTDVNKKTQKMTKNKNISFFVSLLIIATSVVLFIFTFFELFSYAKNGFKKYVNFLNNYKNTIKEEQNEITNKRPKNLYV